MVYSVIFAMSLAIAPRLAAAEKKCPEAREIIDTKAGELCLDTRERLDQWWKVWGIDDRPPTFNHFVLGADDLGYRKDYIEMASAIPGLEGAEKVRNPTLGGMGIKEYHKFEGRPTLEKIVYAGGKTVDLHDNPRQQWEFARVFMDAMRAEYKTKRAAFNKELISKPSPRDFEATQRDVLEDYLDRKEDAIAKARKFLDLLAWVEMKRPGAPALGKKK